MKSYNRLLNLKNLIEQKSHFLFGARGTGKSTLIEKTFPDSVFFDLLDDDIYERLLRNPKIMSESIKDSNQVIIIDEIQRLPKLLNEVQRLMRKIPNRFLLTGSSARKLKMGGANLLAGRAWQSYLYPLSSIEIDDFDLIKYLNYGGLPHVYLSKNPKTELKNYVNLYLKEEILAEALTRKLEYFVRFLDVIAIGNGDELFYQGLSNDSEVPARTIQNYVEILEDTLLGFQLKPFLKTKIRKPITRSKFYLFDLGIVNHLAKRSEVVPGSELFGKAFEHFIVREVKTYLSYAGSDHELFYWRSTSQKEVDLIIGDKIAIEIKATSKTNESHLKGLKALREEGLVKNYCVVSNDPLTRKSDHFYFYFWQDFIKDLPKLLNETR